MQVSCNVLFVNDWAGRRWLNISLFVLSAHYFLRPRSTSSSSRKFLPCREYAGCGLQKSVSSGEKITPSWVLQEFQCIWCDPLHYLHPCVALGLGGVLVAQSVPRLFCSVVSSINWDCFDLRVSLSAIMIDHQSSYPRDFSLSQWKGRMVQWTWWNGRSVSQAKQT